MNVAEVKSAYKIAIIAVAVIAVISISAVVLPVCSDMYGWRYARYSESFIVGNNFENITDRYGAFDVVIKDPDGDIKLGWYQVYGSGGADNRYYSVSFDANGLAVKVEKDVRHPGG